MKLPPLSQAGLDEAIVVAGNFSDELIDAAGRIAQRTGAEEASPTHVRAAGEQLYRSGPARVSQALIALGGLLAGLGGSAFVSALLEDDPHKAMLGGAAGAVVVGTAMMVIGLARQ